MGKLASITLLLALSMAVQAQSSGKKPPKRTQAQSEAKGNEGERVIYKYKQYQKFDFAELTVEGDMGSPGDLSINPRLQKEFRNKLPYRKNFNPELHRSIERVR